MLLTMMKSKLHMARVTSADLNYHGSLGVSRELMEAVGFVEHEKVLCANNENGKRWETYVIPLEEPGRIQLNGAGAHYGEIGERIIVMSFAQMTAKEAAEHVPQVAILDEKNNITEQVYKDLLREQEKRDTARSGK